MSSQLCAPTKSQVAMSWTSVADQKRRNARSRSSAKDRWQQVASQHLLSPTAVTQRMQTALEMLARLLGIPGCPQPSNAAPKDGSLR